MSSGRPPSKPDAPKEEAQPAAKVPVSAFAAPRTKLGPLPLPSGAAHAGAVLSGLLYWLAFPGKESPAWMGLLALVAMTPLWIAVQKQTPRRALWLGLITGATMNVCGFYWLLDMLQTFSGFPTIACAFFVLVVCLYQGGRIGFMGWLYGRATARGWPASLVFLGAFAASELLYPLLFPWYFAATAHKVPVLMQGAELGGPILVGLVFTAVGMAAAEPMLMRLEGRALDRRLVYGAAGALVLLVLFGAVRIPAVDRRAEESPAVHAGLVQGNMGLMQKRTDPAEGLRRHQKLTADLKAKGVEFVVWAESSVTFAVPERIYRPFMRDRVSRALGMSAIFGAVVYRDDIERGERDFNTALATDELGEVTSRYDKEFLLAFGEYLPFGDTFPILYKWSPNSGRFSSGTEIDPLIVSVAGVKHKVSALICYEDILPSFTNKVVRHADPELLVNMTNDAWFGDTSEPWEHLALAQLRAIEHRRYLIRSTNSGVSAFVDPVGRVMSHSGTFRIETLDGIVHWMQGGTVYEAVGDGPWWVVAAFVVVAAFRRRRGGP